MRSLAIGIFYAFISSCLWLLDSVFLSYYGEMSFVDACFAGVPTGRLALRIFICGMLLIIGAMQVAHRLHVSRLASSDRPRTFGVGRIFGSNESRMKNERVLFHCLNIAEQFNMTPEECDALRMLCYCHDIGKVSVPSEILYKQKRTAEEQAIYDMHTVYGSELAASFEDIKDASRLILCHHEYFNGGGVHGYKGDEIPLACRIFSVAWAYDCMVNPKRKARRALICAEALQELRYYEGTAFDPEVVEAFIRTMGRRTLLAGSGQKEFSVTAN